MGTLRTRVGFIKELQHRSGPAIEAYLRTDISHRLALLLNGMLTSLFILVGSFAGLLSLIGCTSLLLLLYNNVCGGTNLVLEMTKFFCYMMSVLGMFIIRRRAELHPIHSMYRTWVGNPVIFASVSGVLIVRGALSAPPLRGPLILLIGILALAILYRSFTSHSRSVLRSI